MKPTGNLLNAALLVGVLGLAAIQFGLAPLLLHSRLAELALVLLLALTTPLHYGLMHETMHGHLFGNERWDRAIGRLLGILLGLPWETMRFGHLAHHSLNRHSYDRPEVLRPGQARLAAAIVYYFKLIVGHALSYVLMPLPALLPTSTTAHVLSLAGTGPEVEQLRRRALRTFTNSKRRSAVRVDIFAVFILFGMAMWVWGPAWPVFAACVVARWSMQSLLDNAPHYGMPLDSGLDARNTSIPAPLRWLLMNGNYHGIHHHAPQLRWRALPAAFARSGAETEGSWFAAVARQFRGPRELEGA
jgi:fatty acid desaturase